VAELPSGTVTFLFTDVEGSTRLLQELGAEGYAAALAEHRWLLREAFSRHGGVEVDTQGDAFFVAFPTAPGALHAATELTGALETGPIRVRVGTHTGTPVTTDEGYVGEDVHRAARIAAAGHGGQVLVSRATARLAEDGVELTSLGLHQLKDFEGDEELFQLGGGVFPPLKTIAPSNLPTPASSFLGRVAELEELSRLLERRRLLTVAGAGGTGKTRLALEVARLSRDRYPGGTFFVELAPVREPELVIPTIAQALGVRDGGRGIEHALAERLSGPSTLLVVDNLEQVVDCAADLARLGRRATGVTVLVTSREALRVDGEEVYELAPLLLAEAVTLFRERAGRAARTGSAAARAGVVEAICERLDCLPLAVELAAARAPVFTPDELLVRLESSVDLLRGGRDADPRQRTLTAAIAWSYDLLEGEEQRVFRALGVFADGCALETAQLVCDAEMQTLESLLDKSLLRRRRAAGGSRVWMLETIRQFAAVRLEAAGEAAGARSRHAEALLAVVRRLAPQLGTPGEAAALDALEDEHADIRLALETLVHTGRPAELAESCVALSEFWSTRDHLPEAIVWLDRALALDGVPTGLLADLHVERGVLATYVDAYEDARRFAIRACELLRRDGRTEALVRPLAGLAMVEVLLGKPERAEPILDEATALSREIGDRHGEREALHLHGEIVRDAGDHERAAVLLGASLALSRELGDLGFEAATTHSLGDLELDRGDLVAAERNYRRSLELSRGLGFHPHVALCVAGLAAVAAARAQPDRAALLWAGVEAFERERGLALHAHERTRYERHLEGVPSGNRLESIDRVLRELDADVPAGRPPSRHP
jgi:predicted ATPase